MAFRESSSPFLVLGLADAHAQNKTTETVFNGLFETFVDAKTGEWGRWQPDPQGAHRSEGNRHPHPSHNTRWTHKPWKQGAGGEDPEARRLGSTQTIARGRSFEGTSFQKL